MMHILFVVPYVPSAIRVRPYQILRTLAARGHAITLICPTRGAADRQELAELQPFCTRLIEVPLGKLSAPRNYLRALPGRLPLQAAHSLSPAFVHAVRTAAQSGAYDCLHLEHLRGAQVGLAALGDLPERPPVVFDAVDCISLLFERALRGSPAFSARLMAFVDLARTRRYETTYQEHFEQVVVTSPEDRWAIETLRAQFGLPTARAISVVPNGVDLDYFTPQAGPREPATLVLSGKMSYHANHAAAFFLLNEIMPLVWRERPAVRIQLVGAHPAPTLQAMARADKRIEVTGYVPDLRPYLARATLAVCPIRYGVGIQNKVLEAMAMATPVIASPQAAVALHARPDQDVLLAAGPQAFAAQILSLLDQPEQSRLIGNAGRYYVEQHHSWSAAAARLEACYQHAAALY